MPGDGGHVTVEPLPPKPDEPPRHTRNDRVTTTVDSVAQIEWKNADEWPGSDAWPPSPTTGLLSAAAGKPIQLRVHNDLIRRVLTGDRLTMWVNRPNEAQHGTMVSADNDKQLQYRFDNVSPGVVHM